MSEIADLLKQKYQERLSGELESCMVDDIGQRVYWKPLTGRQQKIIQKAASNSTAEGICMHVKTRALDQNGEPVFKDVALAGLMNDFDFTVLSEIFFAMTGADISPEDIEKN